MLDLLLLFIALTCISFVGGFAVYWWYVDKIKSVASIVIVLCSYISVGNIAIKKLDDAVLIFVLFLWCCVVFIVGFKVRLLNNKKIVFKRRRR